MWLEQGTGPRTDAEAGAASPPSIRPVQVWENEEELAEEQYVFIPRLDVRASCGDGKLMWEIDLMGQRNAFRKAWADRLEISPEHSATLVAEGDSMEPRICDGDSLVVDYRKSDIRDGKVYALIWQGEFYIKRLLKEAGGGVVLHSDNEAKYPARRIPAEHLDELQIIGRIVAVSGGM
ncbi:S24 family peptidase [Chitiniphilus eburneus]|uniref:S24 family peptidase n=1 Tax=Chitiniphilus eburneus TaxID=2571148 RepID=UPI001FE6B977|nr:S24 family peptidase [Chitiniphilus eburneus]